LNPVLIIFSPFALMNKSDYRNKLCFMSFAVFFILTAFFLDQIRVRYILPVVPVLSILTVMGLINIWNRIMSRSIRLKNLLAVVLISVFIALMSKNIFYVNDYYQEISPLNYFSGRESRDEFITRHISSYPAMKYLNAHTPKNARIKLFFLAQRGYYLDREYEDNASFGMNEIRSLAAHARDDKSFQAYLHSFGCTYLLMRTDLYLKYLRDNFPPETVNLFLQQMSHATETIYNTGGYAIYRLNSSP
jgi:hypothetical protein